MLIIIELNFVEHHPAAIFAHHLQNCHEMLEISDVVDWQVEMSMPEMPNTVLKFMVASLTGCLLIADTHASIQWVLVCKYYSNVPMSKLTLSLTIFIR